MAEPFLPPLPGDWEKTRATLHAYAHAVDAIPRAHGVVHPKWWHVSLKVIPTGLATDPIPLPGGGAIGITMDLRRHRIVAVTTSGDDHVLPMDQGVTGTEMADRLIAIAGSEGLGGAYNRDKFEDDGAREYAPAAATMFLTALVNVAGVFERHRVSLEGAVGQVQLWPHNFDLSFEWMGTRVEEHDGDAYPSQLNLGFYPGDPTGEPYFYSNPWPFEADQLTDHDLPHGAAWHTDGWEGSILPYADLAGDPAAGAKLFEFAQEVYRIAGPTLTA